MKSKGKAALAKEKHNFWFSFYSNLNDYKYLQTKLNESNHFLPE